MEKRSITTDKETNRNNVSKDDIFKQIKKNIVDIAEIDEDAITRQSRYQEDLVIDSIDMMSLIVALEEDYNHRLENEELASLKSVQDTIDIIYSKINS